MLACCRGTDIANGGCWNETELRRACRRLRSAAVAQAKAQDADLVEKHDPVSAVARGRV